MTDRQRNRRDAERAHYLWLLRVACTELARLSCVRPRAETVRILSARMRRAALAEVLRSGGATRATGPTDVAGEG